MSFRPEDLDTRPLPQPGRGQPLGSHHLPEYTHSDSFESEELEYQPNCMPWLGYWIGLLIWVLGWVCGILTMATGVLLGLQAALEKFCM